MEQIIKLLKVVQTSCIEFNIFFAEIWHTFST